MQFALAESTNKQAPDAQGAEADNFTAPSFVRYFGMSSPIPPSLLLTCLTHPSGERGTCPRTEPSASASPKNAIQAKARRNQ